MEINQIDLERVQIALQLQQDCTNAMVHQLAIARIKIQELEAEKVALTKKAAA
jgi:hypothetical protein